MRRENTPGNRDGRFPKERGAKVSTTTSSVEGTGDEKPQADDDSAEISLIGAYRIDYGAGLCLCPKEEGRLKEVGWKKFLAATGSKLKIGERI